jgi:hypothetical protein
MNLPDLALPDFLMIFVIFASLPAMRYVLMLAVDKTLLCRIMYALRLRHRLVTGSCVYLSGQLKLFQVGPVFFLTL